MNISVQLKNRKHILNIKVTLMQSIQEMWKRRFRVSIARVITSR